MNKYIKLVYKKLTKIARLNIETYISFYMKIYLFIYY